MKPKARQGGCEGHTQDTLRAAGMKQVHLRLITDVTSLHSHAVWRWLYHLPTSEVLCFLSYG